MAQHSLSQSSPSPVAPSAFLMAEDNPVDAEIFSDMLRRAFGHHASVICVDRFAALSDALTQGHFQALILDMDLPDQSGLDNVHQIGREYPGLPIVVLTGNEDLDLALDSLQHGAQDYLSKNHATPEILARSIRYAQERKHIEQKLKDALEDAADKNRQLETQAKHDPLTGLANRSYFQDIAQRTLLCAQRNQLQAALLYFDLNEFKKVNDTYGHQIGDELLRQVAERMQQVVRDSDLLARLGGDEFVIITDTLADKRDVDPLIERIQQQFDREFTLGAHRLAATTSIGIAFYPDADNLDLLIKHADCAMYQAKNNPAVDICFYSQQIAEQHTRAQRIESLLGSAIEKDELNAHFQPILNVRDQQEIHIEALARWHSAELGPVRPDEFIAVAENTPAINGITQLMAQRAQALCSTLQQQGLTPHRISINVSAQQLTNEHFCRLFLHGLDALQLPPSRICLELTERQVLQNIQRSKAHFALLQSQDVQLALDDFGSGFSSLTYLLDLPFNILKLDRVLIRDIDQNARNQALVAGIVEMAHRLEMKVVAEGIERIEEQQKAIDLGCDYIQGYLIAKPLPLDQAALFYTQHNAVPA